MNVDRILTQEYNVALYIRLSREDGDKEESESITNQRKILKDFLKGNSNFRFYNEYVDDGYSGTNFNRPSFKRMLKDIKDKKVNMVVTKSLSRLGRDYIETGRYIEQFFPENEVRYISLLDDVDTMLDKNCDTAAFKNIMNDYYAKETSRNVKKTKNRKKKEGFYYASVAPFGYEKINKAGSLRIVKVQAEVIKKIFNLFIEGKGTYQIAQQLNKEKISTPGVQMNMSTCVNHLTGTSNIWKHTQVRRILTNPIYIGNCVQNKTKKISYKSKKIIALSKEDYTITKNHHEPIISIEQFNIVQSIFANHRNIQMSENDVLLKSLLYCAHCHNKLQVVRKQEKYKDTIKYRNYIRCATAERKVSNQICYKQYINYEKFEPLVLSKITEIFDMYLNSDKFKGDEALKKLIEAQNTQKKLKEQLEETQRQLENVNKKLKTLYSDKLNEIIEEQDYKMFSQNLVAERKKLEELKEDLELEIENSNTESKNEVMIEKMQKVLKNILSTNQYTKDVLQQIINKIEVDKDKNVMIHFNFPELNYLGGYIDAQNVSNG